MSNERLALADILLASRGAATRIAYHAGRYYHADEFYATVSHRVGQLQAQPSRRYALFTEDAYPFAVLLFALLHAGKQVWIAGNNRPGTAQQLQEHGCQLIGDWGSGKTVDYALEMAEAPALPLSPLSLQQTQLVIFTSGSTGEPKPIEKNLGQFQLEVTTLEQQWGTLLGDAEVLATVSHQHIYGLLFRVLWPLSAGRCFHSPTYLNPETLANAVHDTACWVASPAHLKRLDQDSPWRSIARLKAVFSSGGALPETAKQQIKTCSGQEVIEIYGSSETGGIAWRQHDSLWQLFDGMGLNTTDGNWQLHSPYLQSHSFQLDDQLSLQADGRFILHGRVDRIVKIEEKRLSLSELERRLVDMPWIAEALSLNLAKSRDVVAAAVVLTETGLAQLKAEGRNALLRQTRSHLNQWFDSVVLPRKWLLLNALPLTALGKIDQPLLTAMLDTDQRKLPQVQSVCITPGSVELLLRVPEELVYFPDHFAGYPILPGVVQLAWVEHFGKLFFALDKLSMPFSQMEVVKFTKTIHPGDELTLSLNWKAIPGKLYFNFSSGVAGYSSGRMIYKKQQRPP